MATAVYSTEPPLENQIKSYIIGYSVTTEFIIQNMASVDLVDMPMAAGDRFLLAT